MSYAALIASIVIYGFVLLRTAWVGEDAFITLRVVDNLANGYGPVWNTQERVQAFTHPLWMLTISAFYTITREPFFTTIALSVVLSLCTVAIILFEAREDPKIVLLVAFATVGSKAFMDYSTSGLENPLSHLLIVSFFALYVRDIKNIAPANTFKTAALAGLAILNRMDISLIVLPALIERIARINPWKDRLKAIATFGSPIIAWMAFSILYYGFPLPNTYYAKQAAAVSRIEYIERGAQYVTNLILNDPLTALVIVAGIGSVLAREQRRLWPLITGALLYLLYIVWSGGDFMQGRFFSPVFAVSILSVTFLLSNKEIIIRQSHAFLAITLVFLLGFAAKPVPNLLSDQNYPRPLFHPSMRIVDERGFYYWASGLLPALNGSGLSQMPWVQQGMKSREIKAKLHVFGEVGYRGYFAGPQVEIIDPYALTDAFLARLPFIGPSDWRIGHLWHPIPPGYLETRLTGKNQLEDQSLRRLYDELSIITRGPLWSVERLKAIIQLNLSPPAIDPRALDKPTKDLTYEQFAQGIHFVGERGLRIFLPASQEHMPEAVALLSSAGNEYSVRFSKGEITRATFTLPAYEDRAEDESVVHYLSFDKRDIGEYDTIRIVANRSGVASFAGMLHLVPDPFLVRTRMPRRYGIVLSSTIGLSSLSKPYTWVSGRRMVGFWEADQKGDFALSMSIFSPCASEQSQTVVVKANGMHLAAHSWNEETCATFWRPTLLIPSTLIRKGINTIEIESDIAFNQSLPESQGVRYPSVAVEWLKVDTLTAR